MVHLLKSTVYLFVCCLVLNGGALRAEQYALDNSHTSIIFGVSHFGYSHTYGRFSRVGGKFSWDNTDPEASQFVLAIDVASIDTNDAKRDEHLRSADFFNARQFPQIVFRSTSVRPSPGNPEEGMFDVVGNFTMHGVTKEVVLSVKKLGEGLGPYGKYRSGFSCQTTIKRSDFGMTNMLPKIGDEVAITISFEGLRQ